MKLEARLFMFLVPFFLVVAAVYAVWSHLEPVGSAGILLLGATVGMIGFYLWQTGRRIDPRPEDNPYGDVEEGAGEQGVFSPWSWWPLVVALGAALTFAALAIGWWMFGVGVVLGFLGLIGWVFEYSRGLHAH